MAEFCLVVPPERMLTGLRPVGARGVFEGNHFAFGVRSPLLAVVDTEGVKILWFDALAPAFWPKVKKEATRWFLGNKNARHGEGRRFATGR